MQVACWSEGREAAQWRCRDQPNGRGRLVLRQNRSEMTISYPFGVNRKGWALTFYRGNPEGNPISYLFQTFRFWNCSSFVWCSSQACRSTHPVRLKMGSKLRYICQQQLTPAVQTAQPGRFFFQWFSGPRGWVGPFLDDWNGWKFKISVEEVEFFKLILSFKPRAAKLWTPISIKVQWQYWWFQNENDNNDPSSPHKTNINPSPKFHSRKKTKSFLQYNTAWPMGKGPNLSSLVHVSSFQRTRLQRCQGAKSRPRPSPRRHPGAWLLGRGLRPTNSWLTSWGQLVLGCPRKLGSKVRINGL